MIELQQVSKHYGPTDPTKGVRALDTVSVSIGEGEQVALVGASGSGKSTLLNIIGGIDTPTDGRVIVAGREVTSLGDREMTRLRREVIGIVFQFFNLMPTLSVVENVMLPAELAGANRAESREHAMELLRRVGMEHRADHIPNELSGGEMQRTAIARALINRPQILLADEPTGNLDSANGAIVLDMLQEMASVNALTLVMATHDRSIAGRAGRIIEMRDGRVVAGGA